jgi:hypothetical protein
MKELRDNEIAKGKAAIPILYCSTEKRYAKMPAMKMKILGKNHQK